MCLNYIRAEQMRAVSLYIAVNEIQFKNDSY